MVIVAPAFTSVGVTPVINGCDAVDGVEGSDFEQPDGRVTTNNAKMIKTQPGLFGDMIVSSE